MHRGDPEEQANISSVQGDGGVVDDGWRKCLNIFIKTFLSDELTFVVVVMVVVELVVDDSASPCPAPV